MAGWKENISDAKSIAELPPQTRFFLNKIEETTGVPVWIVSLGASREKVIFLRELSF
jgi:adenylosuccinate synthase